MSSKKNNAAGNPNVEVRTRRWLEALARRRREAERYAGKRRMELEADRNILTEDKARLAAIRSKLADFDWRPSFWVRETMERRERIQSSQAAVVEGFSRDAEDMWRRPRLRADVPLVSRAESPHGVAEVYEVASAAGRVRRSFRPKKRRGKRGGRKVNRHLHQKNRISSSSRVEREARLRRLL